ncbi:RNI-like protein [Trichoderma citrinoviride]|uniref:RNI-like protein n=1 Tax=Trichoderma citrinoviride TaxID=58853 RepID=A0A2T4BL47_9HYPO|nr:RNI-like protein [Trichoderma citrinoviride]PTB70001.1 RNI-like protein [Trichoderma citrinoviride]
MEQVHGVDSSPVATVQPRSIPNDSPLKLSPQTTAESTEAKSETSGKPVSQTQPIPVNGTSGARRLSRSGSLDKQNSVTPPHRRNSWFSNISAKFSGAVPQANGQAPQTGNQQHAPSQQQQPSAPTNSEPIVPKITPTKNAVLQHGLKPEGDEPYTPAPPRSGQPGILGVFRRLSSSGGGSSPLGAAGKFNHGLVERRILNVDRDRERCPIAELKDNKLRRVSFFVDVEVAPMPKYAETEADTDSIDHTQKKKLSEKGEGEALKHPKVAEAQKEACTSSNESVSPGTAEAKPREAESKPAAPTQNGTKPADGSEEAKPKDMTRKKEKKKRSEEERKARKEKRRRLAEESGAIPIEIHYDSSDSAELRGISSKTTSPTINPVRIYRRCCQLRETPILKKITEQLSDTANILPNGCVNKIDLTGYFMQLQDLITLGDYLAIVSVKEVILQNSGLTDEGVRVILAGLLAAKNTEPWKRRNSNASHESGGVVERVVLKENKLGPDGWKHIALFIYKCRSLKYLDLSSIPFPRQPPANANGALRNGVHIPLTIAEIFARALADRPAGSALEMLSIGETEPSMEQLGKIMDGVIKCGVKRLSTARNPLDNDGVQHVVRYLESGNCEGLDLGGIDLREHMDTIAGSIRETDPLWALSISDCNLTPSSLRNILPVLAKLKNFVFIDLSHNHDLFQSTPSAVGLLRRYIPKMQCLKRLHLSDVDMTAEQAIAIVEVVPEARHLCHLSLLGNKEIVALASAKTEEAQEEACALYASLMAATRLSKSLICVDIEVPSEDAGEIVKAMAKQVVAYCLQNIEHLHDFEINKAVATALAEAKGESMDGKTPSYPDVLAHLVGHDVLDQDDLEEDDSGPDEDYVIGGTGVVKALACCLKNRGDESRRASGEFFRAGSVEEEPLVGPKIPTGGKAKDLSKHLLAGARKIRLRLQPALNKARANPSDENLRKLNFLDETLQGIIKRFEDEYPDTREDTEEAEASSQPEAEVLSSSPPTLEDAVAGGSDPEDEGELVRPSLSRSNSILGKKLDEEEGRVHRAGHRFRFAFTEHIDLLTTLHDVEKDPKHAHFLYELAEDVGGEFLELAKKKGAVQAFKEDKDILFAALKESDPEYWERFVEAQRKARANITVPAAEKNEEGLPQVPEDESAIAD